MEAERRQICVEASPLAATGTFVVTNFRSIEALLEGHAARMRELPALWPVRSKPLQRELLVQMTDRISPFQHSLLATAELVSEWQRLQQEWTLLQHFFAWPEMRRRFPSEGKLFSRQVDRGWRELMAEFDAPANVFEGKKIALDHFSHTEPYLKSIQEWNAVAMTVKPVMSAYLQEVRASFPRFHLPADDGLLDLLCKLRSKQRCRMCTPPKRARPLSK